MDTSPMALKPGGWRALPSSFPTPTPPEPRTSPQGVQPQSLNSHKLAVYTLGQVLH